MRRPKPLPVPMAPALVRKGMAAVAMGLGLTGSACGGEESVSRQHGAVEAGSDGAMDEASEAVAPVPPPVPPTPTPVPPTPTPNPPPVHDAGAADGRPPPPVPPLPPPHP